MRTSHRAAIPALLLSLASACGSETPPSPVPPAPLMLAAGTYTFTTSTVGASCVATGQAPANALSVQTRLDQRGSDSVFLPADQPGSTFEFWIHRTSTTGVNIQINGQILGSVRISTTPIITADFGALGIISGTTNLTQGSGLISGQVRFIDTSANALTCTGVRWAFVRE